MELSQRSLVGGFFVSGRNEGQREEGRGTDMNTRAVAEDRRKSEKILLSITRGDRRRVERFAARQGLSLAGVARKALTEFLDEVEGAGRNGNGTSKEAAG